jgi:hypothetical protein
MWTRARPGARLPTDGPTLPTVADGQAPRGERDERGRARCALAGERVRAARARATHVSGSGERAGAEAGWAALRERARSEAPAH